jgi:hypothetical protein
VLKWIHTFLLVVVVSVGCRPAQRNVFAWPSCLPHPITNSLTLWILLSCGWPYNNRTNLLDTDNDRQTGKQTDRQTDSQFTNLFNFIQHLPQSSWCFTMISGASLEWILALVQTSSNRSNLNFCMSGHGCNVTFHLESKFSYHSFVQFFFKLFYFLASLYDELQVYQVPKSFLNPGSNN